MSTGAKRAREFWLRQYSEDGGYLSNVRVMKPSDCDIGERPPDGHDNVKYFETVHVIEHSAYQALMDHAKALAGALEEFVQWKDGRDEAQKKSDAIGGHVQFATFVQHDIDFRLREALANFRAFIAGAESGE
jgi:hypothetical protein